MSHRGDDTLLLTLKRVAATLKQAEIPFALAGQLRGVRPRRPLQRPRRRLPDPRGRTSTGPWRRSSRSGFAAERPPEDWLVKVYDEEPAGRPDLPAGRDARSPTRRSPTRSYGRSTRSTCRCCRRPSLMVHKLLSYSQHYCDFARGLPLARSLREQIDWDRVRKETGAVPVRRGVPRPARPAGRGPLPGAQMTWGDEMTTDRRIHRSRGAAACSPRTSASPSRASRSPGGRTRWCCAARWRAPHRRDEMLRLVHERFPGRGDHRRHRRHPGRRAHRGGGAHVIRIAAVGDVHLDEDVVGPLPAGAGQDRRSAPTCCCSPAT